MPTTTTTARPRAAALRSIEREVGVLLRRVRRVIGVRARAVHPDLQPASYLVLTHLEERGPSRGSAVVEDLGIDKGAVSRQIQHLVDLGLLDAAAGPGRRPRDAALAHRRRPRRLDRVQAERSERFDRRLGELTTAELVAFADQLGRYNAALDDLEQG